MNSYAGRLDGALARVQFALAELSTVLVCAVRANEGATGHCTSNRSGLRPPGRTPRWCREWFPTIDGARKEGRDPVVSTQAFDAWVEARLRRTTRPRATSDRAWSPETALADAHVRISRTQS